jgi:hypothetical protein
MIKKFCLKVFKGHSGCSSGEVEEGNKCGVGRVEASKDIGYEVLVFNRLTCCSQ